MGANFLHICLSFMPNVRCVHFHLMSRYYHLALKASMAQPYCIEQHKFLCILNSVVFYSTAIPLLKYGGSRHYLFEECFSKSFLLNRVHYCRYLIFAVTTRKLLWNVLRLYARADTSAARHHSLSATLVLAASRVCTVTSNLRPNIPDDNTLECLYLTFTSTLGIEFKLNSCYSPNWSYNFVRAIPLFHSLIF